MSLLDTRWDGRDKFKDRAAAGIINAVPRRPNTQWA